MIKRPQQPSQSEESDSVTVSDDEQTDRVLELLSDSNCRQILRATDDEALSAEELSDRCTIPQSTVYRKVERLVDSGLLEEGVRLSTDSQLTHEYSLAVTSVDVTLADESGVSLTLSRTGETALSPNRSEQSAPGD